MEFISALIVQKMHEKLLEIVSNTRSNAMRTGERVNIIDTPMQFCEQSSWSTMAKDGGGGVEEGGGGGGEARIGPRTEAEQRRMEAPPRSKLPFIFEALTCTPQYMPALRYPCS